jgi:hypothetical protein
MLQKTKWLFVLCGVALSRPVFSPEMFDVASRSNSDEDPPFDSGARVRFTRILNTHEKP